MSSMTANKHITQRIPLLLFSFAFLIAIVAIAINSLKSRSDQLSQTGNIQVTLSPTPTIPPYLISDELHPSLTTDETGKWKTYTNTEFGFSFRLPAELNLTIIKNSALNQFSFYFKPASAMEQEPQEKAFNINVLNNPRYLPAQDFVRQVFRDEKKILQFGSLPISLGNAVWAKMILNPHDLSIETDGPTWIVQGVSNSPYMFSFSLCLANTSCMDTNTDKPIFSSFQFSK